MDAKADARPFTGRIRPDQCQPLVFADDREFTFLQRRVRRRHEAESIRMKPGLHRIEEPRKFAFPLQRGYPLSFANMPCSCIALPMSPSTLSLPVMKAVIPSSAPDASD